MRSCYRVAPSLHSLKLTRRNNFECYASDLHPVGPDGIDIFFNSPLPHRKAPNVRSNLPP